MAWFRAVSKKYPDKPQPEILADLVASTPGDEGKWFAAAKSVGLLDQALALAQSAPCAPQTLTRLAPPAISQRRTRRSQLRRG